MARYLIGTKKETYVIRERFVKKRWLIDSGDSSERERREEMEKNVGKCARLESKINIR
jgi:hypothetical protein